MAEVTHTELGIGNVCHDCKNSTSEKCSKFVPNRLKKNLCLNCLHDAFRHEGTTQEEQAAAVLAKDDTHACLIDDHLYMGSVKAAMNTKELKEKKITHVINCARGLGTFFPKFKQNHDEFSFLNLELDDDGLIDIPFDVMVKTLEFIDSAKNRGGGVLVHCAQGVNRSGTVVCAYLMKKHKVTYEEALVLAQKGRSLCQPNVNYTRQLKAMEKDILSHTS